MLLLRLYPLVLLALEWTVHVSLGSSCSVPAAVYRVPPYFVCPMSSCERQALVSPTAFPTHSQHSHTAPQPISSAVLIASTRSQHSVGSILRPFLLPNSSTSRLWPRGCLALLALTSQLDLKLCCCSQALYVVCCSPTRTLRASTIRTKVSYSANCNKHATERQRLQPLPRIASDMSSIC